MAHTSAGSGFDDTRAPLGGAGSKLGTALGDGWMMVWMIFFLLLAGSTLQFVHDVLSIGDTMDQREVQVGESEAGPRKGRSWSSATGKLEPCQCGRQPSRIPTWTACLQAPLLLDIFDIRTARVNASLQSECVFCTKENPTTSTMLLRRQGP